MKSTSCCTKVALKAALKAKSNEKWPYEAFSFVMVPKKPWAPKRKTVSSAHGSLLRQP